MSPLTAGLAAVAAFVVAAILAASGAPQALVAHLVFAVGVVPLVFAAILHFVPVLTRTGAPSSTLALLPWAAQAAGGLAVLAFAGWMPRGALSIAAAIDLLLAGVLALWILRRRGAALGGAHPGWRWYLAALAALMVALAAIAAIELFPEAFRSLRALHIHLNTLGFLGLAAFGTLPVLLPTAVRRPDPGARRWLAACLPLVAAGAALVAVGAALSTATIPFDLPLIAAIVGAVLLVSAALALLWRWSSAYGVTAIAGGGAASSLAAAVAGFVVLLPIGVLHAFPVLAQGAAVAAFGGLFLLPLVSGALSQLLPVWRFPGVDTVARQRLAWVLGSWSRLRVACFLSGGVLFALGRADWAIAVVATGLLLLLGVTLVGLNESRAGGR